jgi:hypothetical protein
MKIKEPMYHASIKASFSIERVERLRAATGHSADGGNLSNNSAIAQQNLTEQWSDWNEFGDFTDWRPRSNGKKSNAKGSLHGTENIAR